ncbi:hypothetical protein [Neobacillus sp. D3-1R]|uniref:hypothetical protein n=1 Tax=Neobacillus sp. D3-1R TaxID=3445778 RepID=UPI003F9FB020
MTDTNKGLLFTAGIMTCIVELLVEVSDMTDISGIDIVDTNASEKEVKSSEFAKGLGVAESTIRKYSQQLESAGYVFKKDSTGARIFTMKDYSVFTDLIRWKSKPGISLEIAANISVSQKTGVIQRHENVQPLAELNSNEIIDATKNEIKVLQNTFEAKFEEIKKDRLTAAVTIRRIESKLRKEAMEMWEQQPDEVKFLVKGWLFKTKEENYNKKNEFIQKYIDDKFDDRLNIELNILG